MSKDILVIAPHPDDETLGCGGTILRHVNEGAAVHWLIVTSLPPQRSARAKKLQALREKEIRAVAKTYRFSSTHMLGLPTTRLDEVPLSKLVQSIGNVVASVGPEIVYLPFRGDIHSDHTIVFDAAAANTKWFRYRTVKRVLAYETISETDFSMRPGSSGFHANVFVDITDYLDQKIRVMMHYAGETGPFPFPRSEETLRAYAAVRGSAAGCRAAEAFMLLKEIV